MTQQLGGASLCNEETIISFVEMTHYKMKGQQIGTNFPLHAEGLFKELNKFDQSRKSSM